MSHPPDFLINVALESSVLKHNTKVYAKPRPRAGPASAAETLPESGKDPPAPIGTARMVCCRSPSISGMAAAPIRVQAWGGAVESVRKASRIREGSVFK